jgi:hypothetical protein
MFLRLRFSITHLKEAVTESPELLIERASLFIKQGDSRRASSYPYVKSIIQNE